MSAPFYLDSKSKRSKVSGTTQGLVTPKTVSRPLPSFDLNYSLANVPTQSGVVQRVRKKRKVGDNYAIKAVEVSDSDSEDGEERRTRKRKIREKKEKFVGEYNKARDTRKKSKDKFEKDKLVPLKGKDKKVKKNTVFNDYKNELESNHPKDHLLKQGFKFGDANESGLQEVTYDGDVVGTFATGPSAFKKKSDATDTSRSLYEKEGTPGTFGPRNYVLDDRGTVTRQDAFAEKNLYQGIELATTGKIKGRWQQFHQALGYTPNYVERNLRDPEGAHFEFGKARDDYRIKRDEDFTLSELAQSHQWLGNGSQQRGNSLTSTPRPGGVYSNDGDPFRNSSGLRIQYDLSRVLPTDKNTLVNHYGQTNLDNFVSVKDAKPLRDGAFFKHNGSRQTDQFSYNYADSVDKNREIYLTETRLKDISGINFHKGDDNANDVTPVLTSDPEQTRATIKQHLRYDKFKEGFDGYKSDEDIPDSGTNPDEEAVIKGKKFARSYHSGRKRGKDWRRKSRGSASFKDLDKYFGHDKTQHTQHGITGTEAGDFYHDIYRVGWAHEAAEEERLKNKDLIGYKPGEKITLNPGLFGEPFK